MMTPHEIESLARSIEFEPDTSANERILGPAEKALNDRQEIPRVAETRLRWRYGMQLRIAKWAVAAAVLTALGLHFLGGSIGGTGVTFADVLAQIREFRPYRCRYSVEEANWPTDIRILERLSPARRRELLSDGSILVYDLSIPKELALYPDKRFAHEHWPDFEPKRDFDLLSLVNSMQERAAEERGRSTLEGHEVAGFPAYNGMSAAGSKLFISTRDGKLLCLEGERQGDR